MCPYAFFPQSITSKFQIQDFHKTPSTLPVHKLPPPPQKKTIKFVPDKYLLVNYKLKLPYSHVTNATARADITVKDQESVIFPKYKGNETRVHHGTRSEFSFQLCWQWSSAS